MANRHFRPTFTPRHLLQQSRHAQVDFSLKNLKICSRRLRNALGAFRDEHIILERIRYKGRNQHRASLFWKRVMEIMRYCRRLSNARIGELIDSFRGCFFGDDHSNLKLMKGAWTHYPDVSTTKSILRRVTALVALTVKMRDRLDVAFSILTLMMQSGIFLQLVLVLSAIISRLAIITSEITEALRMTLKVIQGTPDLYTGEWVSHQVTADATANVLENSPSSVISSSILAQENNEVAAPEASHIVVGRNIRQDNLLLNKVEHHVCMGLKKREGKFRTDEIDDIFSKIRTSDFFQ